MMRTLLGVFVIAALSGATALASPIHVSAPSVTSYLGAKIVMQVDASNPLTGMQLFIQAGLDRETPNQSGLAALVAESIVRTPVGGLPLQDELLAKGGSITYTVDGHWIRFYLEGLSPNFATGIMPLFEQALAKPDFSATTLASSRAELDRKIAENEKIPLDVGIQMLNTAFYTDSDAGLPQYGLPATLAGFTSSDAQRFYSTYYRRGGAVVSAVGGVNAATQSQFSNVLGALAEGTSKPVPVRLSRLSGSEHHLVTHRDIAVPWLVAQFRAPSIGSRDFGAMLVLTSFLERTAAEVAENPSVTTKSFNDRAVGTLYNFDDRPASVVLFINGGFGDPSRPFSTALSVIQIFAHSKLSGDIGGMKSIAAGNYIDGVTTLEDRAWMAGVFASQDLPPNYIERGLNAITSVTGADLQRVARTYLDNPNVAIVLPRDTPSPT
ncbi:MAG: insulinase family protein [Candidatus Eremiobacteraeota bacterium]|nr:insulinase family protein [Candidatus Eremiobacteraeota bacterium]